MVFHFQGLYWKQELDLEMLTLWETLRKMVLHTSHAGEDLGLLQFLKNPGTSAVS